MFSLRITDVAERDIQRNFEWWRDNRSAEQAARWCEGIFPAIATLTKMPRRCSLAREADFHDIELRQLQFGIGRRSTHRILFTIDGDAVVILKVLHNAQKDFTEDI